MNRHSALRNQKSQAPAAALHNLSPKTLAAIVLMSMMAILWGRVLLNGKSGPDSAAAAAEDLVMQQQAAALASQTDTSIRLTAVDLPFAAGRSDTLACDLFSTARWTAFQFQEDGVSQAPDSEVPNGLTEERKHVAALDAIAAQLVLEAVIQGTDGRAMQAFVGGKILSVGQTLTAEHQGQKYTLTISEIAPQQAVLTWRSYSIRLRITESQEL